MTAGPAVAITIIAFLVGWIAHAFEVRAAAERKVETLAPFHAAPSNLRLIPAVRLFDQEADGG